jgi:hypothetical protein
MQFAWAVAVAVLTVQQQAAAVVALEVLPGDGLSLHLHVS